MSIKALGVAMGLVVVLCCGWASAQDASKPQTIQVIISADGTLKIIDAKTGKVLGTAQIDKKDLQIEKKGDPKADEKKLLEKRRLEELKLLEQLLQEKERALKQQRELEEAVRQAEEAHQRAKEAIEKKAPRTYSYPGNWPYPWFQSQDITVVIGPDGKAKIVNSTDAKKPVAQPASNADQKLDLILKQLGELRRDVDAIKQKLDGKKPVNIHWQMVPGSKPRKDGTIELEIVPVPAKDKKPGGIEFEFFPGPANDKNPGAPSIQIIPLPAGKDGKKLDPEVLKRLDKIIQELEQKDRDRRSQEIEKNKKNLPQSEDLLEAQRQLERMIRELQELERKNRKDQ